MEQESLMQDLVTGYTAYVEPAAVVSASVESPATTPFCYALAGGVGISALVGGIIGGLF